MRIMWKLMQEISRLRRHEDWSRAQLVSAQADQLHRLREFAYARSPFYRRFHRGLTDRPLGELPVLTKAQLMESFDELITTRSVRLGDVRPHLARDNHGPPYLN